MMRRSMLGAIGLVLLMVGQAQAKGAPSVVTITGSGIAHPIVVHEPAARALGLGGFEELVSGSGHVATVKAPHTHGRGYDLNRDGWDHARYYPRCGGGRGYVHYIGLYNGWSEYDGKWFHVSAAGELAVRHILMAHHVAVTSCAG